MRQKKEKIIGIIVATCIAIIFLYGYVYIVAICSWETKLAEELRVVLALYICLVLIYISIISIIIKQKKKNEVLIGGNYLLNLVAYSSFLVTQGYLLVVIADFKLLFQNYNGLELYLEFDRLWALLGVIFLEIICILFFILVFKKFKILYVLLILFIIGTLCLPIAYVGEKLYYTSIENGVITQKTTDGYNIKLVSNSEDSGQVASLDKGWYYVRTPERTDVEITYNEKYNTIYDELYIEPSYYEEGSLIFYYDDNTKVELSKEWTNNVIFHFKKLTEEEVKNNLQKRYTNLTGQKTYEPLKMESGSIIITKDDEKIYKYERNRDDISIKKWKLKDGKYEEEEEEKKSIMSSSENLEQLELLEKSFLLTPMDYASISEIG